MFNRYTLTLALLVSTYALTSVPAPRIGNDSAEKSVIAQENVRHHAIDAYSQKISALREALKALGAEHRSTLSTLKKNAKAQLKECKKDQSVRKAEFMRTLKKEFNAVKAELQKPTEKAHAHYKAERERITTELLNLKKELGSFLAQRPKKANNKGTKRSARQHVVIS